MVQSDDILNLGISFAEICGVYNKTYSTKAIILRIVYGIISAVILYYAVLDLFYVNGVAYIKSLEGITSILHVAMKYFLPMYYNNEFTQIYQDIEQFWKPTNHQIRILTDKMFKNGRKAQLCMSFLVLGVCLIYEIKSIVNEDDIDIYQTWHSKDYLILDIIILSFQFYFVFICIFSLSGYECIFLSLCVHLMVQFKLLQRELLSSNVHEPWKEKLKKCIRHHQLLFSVCNRMKNIYFSIFLLQYMVTLGSICSEIYILGTAKTTKISDVLIAAFYGGTLYFQFGYYCVPAELVMAEMSGVSNAIYMSNWHDMPISYQKGLSVMLLRSQTQGFLIGGGLFKIDVALFSSIIGKAFSFYTVIKNVLQ